MTAAPSTIPVRSQGKLETVLNILRPSHLDIGLILFFFWFRIGTEYVTKYPK